MQNIIPGCHPTGPVPTNTTVEVFMPTVGQDREGGLVKTGLSGVSIKGVTTSYIGGEHTITVLGEMMVVPDDGRVVAV